MDKAKTAEARKLANKLKQLTKKTRGKGKNKEIRDLITEIGQDYVDTGLITKETFQRNRDIYSNWKKSFTNYNLKFYFEY